MDLIDIRETFDKLKFGEDAFHELMRWRVRRVLLVLPHYDAWILEHDAKLSDQIVGEYHQLNLTTVPRLTTVADGEEALSLLAEQEFELLIIGKRVGDLTPGELAARAKQLRSDMAVLMLFPSRSDLATDESTDEEESAIDARFLWSGDSRLFLAMIKYVEDVRNAPADAGDGRVGVLLVVEDSIAFYSAYLPLLYIEVMVQTQRLIAEEMNDSDKFWRMRTRPKVLLARNWEEALTLGETYRKALIGIISDIGFSKAGKMNGRAGFDLVERFRADKIWIPVLFQSSDDNVAEEASTWKARFQGKLSGDLLRGIRRFLLEDLGFGDFVFRNPDGQEVRRVRTLREFELALAELPTESILYHADRDDYSRWLNAHGEYQVARRIKPVRSADFSTSEEHRVFLVRSFREIRESRHRGRLVEYRPDDPGAPGSIARYGSGSLGGKGRGLAFFNAVLSAVPWGDRFEPLKVTIPRTLIIATGEFDKFLEIHNFSTETLTDDEALHRSFLDASLSQELTEVLRSFISQGNGPLAVRSSALLEDSQSIPLAGVYDTYMIPDCEDSESKLRSVSDAVKLVWASTFSREAALYREAMGVGREEEKMAVVIQDAAGARHENWWFPRLSGTAQSLNYYPVGPMEREDGAARIAIGMGRSVVEGNRGFLFCPSHPSVPWGTEEDRWREGQTHFWAIQRNLNRSDPRLSSGEGSNLVSLTVKDAENMGVLRHMASTWDSVDHKLVDGIDTAGPRVIDFRDFLEYEWLPLAQLLKVLLKLSRSALGSPVELEFALDWQGDYSDNAVFSLLQVRPLISPSGTFFSLPEKPADEDLLLYSETALGHGILEGIRDVVWVDPDIYDAGKTESYRDEVAAVMDELAQADRPAILLGPGRWGSRDRFLGIPVSWAQVRQARLIVEVDRGSGDPEPSQGSHFFHNLVALGVGYAHVSRSKGFIDWEFLKKRSMNNSPVCHSVLDNPVTIIMDGKNGNMWIEK